MAAPRIDCLALNAGTLTVSGTASIDGALDVGGDMSIDGAITSSGTVTVGTINAVTITADTVTADTVTTPGVMSADHLNVTDGITAPSTTAGRAKIYVDTADGDLKVRFGDGTIKTIVVDT